MTDRTTHIAVALLLAVLVGACTSDEDPGEGLLVVATTSILGDIASNVVGDEGRVEVLIPIGADAHDFQPSAQQGSLIAEADLVLANGLGLEEGLQDILSSTAEDGTPVIELATLLDPLPFSTPEGQGGEPGHGEDPHFWMDPIRVGEGAIAVASALTGSHPDRGWQHRARAYADEMGVTDDAIRGLVEDVPEHSRRMVTNHEAFGYFADRYGFEIVGVVIPGGSTLAEPSSAELADLVETMAGEDVRVIFAETSRPTDLAESIAAEVGENVQVVELFTESLGPAGSGAETLAGLLLTNAERIASSLE